MQYIMTQYMHAQTLALFCNGSSWLRPTPCYFFCHINLNYSINLILSDFKFKRCHIFIHIFSSKNFSKFLLYDFYEFFLSFNYLCVTVYATWKLLVLIFFIFYAKLIISVNKLLLVSQFPVNNLQFSYCICRGIFNSHFFNYCPPMVSFAFVKFEASVSLFVFCCFWKICFVNYISNYVYVLFLNSVFYLFRCK